MRPSLVPFAALALFSVATFSCTIRSSGDLGLASARQAPPAAAYDEATTDDDAVVNTQAAPPITLHDTTLVVRDQKFSAKKGRKSLRFRTVIKGDAPISTHGFHVELECKVGVRMMTTERWLYKVHLERLQAVEPVVAEHTLFPNDLPVSPEFCNVETFLSTGKSKRSNSVPEHSRTNRFRFCFDGEQLIPNRRCEDFGFIATNGR